MKALRNLLLTSSSWDGRGDFAIIRDLGIGSLPGNGSITTIARSLTDPRLDAWTKYEKKYTETWTGRCQGVATNGRSWFISSNDDGDPGIFRYSADLKIRQAYVPRPTGNHIGDIDYHREIVYAPFEGPNDDSPAVLGRFTPDLDLIDLREIERPIEDDDKRHFSWSAINPWNGLLYTCDWNHAGVLYAFDPQTGDRVVESDIELQTTVHHVQGAAFSENGRVYLASDSDRPGIYSFRVLNGHSLGYLKVDRNAGIPDFEEVEGICVGSMSRPVGTYNVHLVLLDKNGIGRDAIYLKSYRAPDGAVV